MFAILAVIYAQRRNKEDSTWICALVCTGAVIVFYVFFAFRGYVYSDWVGYSESYKDVEWSDIFAITNKNKIGVIHEPGFTALMCLCSIFTREYAFLVIVITTIDTLLFIRFLRQWQVENIPFAFMLFFTFLGVGLMFNALRNQLAIFIFMNALIYIERKQPLPYFLICLLALCFHVSSIIFCPLYFFLGRKLNKWIFLGLVITFFVFYISQTTVGTWLADILVGWIETFQEWAGEQLGDANPLLYALLIDGVIGGVGAVVGFLPLVMVMYFLIALLEDSGYMARVSAVMDPIFKRVGLSGKSVIPVVIGTGCGIPAIMSCRTIRDERERRATSMLATFIPCGAKIPVIALFAGAFFAGAGWVSLLSYFFGLVLIFLGALLIKAITGYKYRKSFFIMELPKFKVPSLKFAFKSMMERAKAYIIKAATIILICNTIVQVMQTFNWQFQVVEEGMENTSILASIASPFAFLLIPLGFGVWQLAAAAITGFIAKENVVGTLAVVYGLTAFIDVDELALTGGANNVAMAMGLTSVTALAYLFFNLYTPPCFAAIGAMNSEMKSKGWLWGAIGLQLGTGYTVAFLIYQFGTLFTEGHFGQAFVPGLIAVLCMVAIVILIGRKTRAHFDEQYRLHQAAKA